MKCPKCRNEILQKSVDRAPSCCPKCQGIWVLDALLPKISSEVDEQHGKSEAAAEHDRVTGLCPSGHGIMIRAKVDLPTPFYLEKCAICGGIWFDKGEAQRIGGTIFLENLNELWSRAWQHKQRKEQNRKRFLEINQKLLGDEAF